MADNVDADTASWKEIEVTFYVTAATSVVFLMLFEIARRRPSVAPVFDRRRRYYYSAAAAETTSSSRTPPPLLHNTILEWLFLSTDPTYQSYADVVHTQTVIRERKRQQKECRKKRSNTTKPHAAVVQAEDAPIESMMDRGDQPEDNVVDDAAADEETAIAVVKQKKKVTAAVANTALTPDVVIVNGRRLHVSVVQEVEVWNLTDAQLQAYEEQLVEMELDSEQRFRERYQSILMEQEERKRRKKNLLLSLSGNSKREGEDDEAALQPRVLDFDDSDSESGLNVSRIVPPPRWRYLGLATFLQSTNEESDENGNKMASVRVAGTRGFLDSPKSLALLRVSSMSDDEEGARPKNATGSDDGSDQRAIRTKDSTVEEYKSKNQYLKSVSDKVTRPLSVADEELLRCVGLDAYVMLRFLRFGFDVTFYPFLLACVVLLPTYYTHEFSEEEEFGDVADTKSGYFRFTFNRLEQGSILLWVPWAYAAIYFAFFLYRLHVEWETFVALRSDFLANGDAGMDSGFFDTTNHIDSEEAQKRVIQYRNSCLVEYIPVSHQSDQGLFEFFDAIFPNQVERAEILMKADSLTKLIAKRQKLVERYETIYAKYFHVHQKHRRTVEYLEQAKGSWRYYICCRCCRGLPRQPPEPTIRMSGRCCCRKMEKLLPHLLSKIQEMNEEIDAEHAKISDAKKNVDQNAGKKNLLSQAVGKGIQFVTGNEQYTCSTGFVEFKNLSTKQNALQCNVSGTTRFMTTASAPDPRDLSWDNAGEGFKRIRVKLRQCQILLCAGVILWFFVVSFVTSISDLDRLSKYVPSYLVPEQDTYWYGIVQGYLPVVALELLMLLVPIALRFVASKYIRLKTNSEVDKFVFIWHFAYRVANLVIIIVKNQVIETLTLGDVRNDIRGTVGTVAKGVAMSSQFFMNNMIAAAGTATMWELAQMPSMIIHFFTYKVVTVEAKSKRALEKLDQPNSFEWGDIYPTFIFALLVGTVYATIVPFLLGVCAVFFYLATKVYTHQALFVYVQPYEGGGKLMYLLNRTLFTIVYFSIAIVSLLFGLKEGRYEAPTFFAVMILLTLYVDWRIQTKFVAPSIALNLTNARIIDNEEKVRRRQAKKRRKGKVVENPDSYDSFIFRQPQMNKSLWETKPRPYR